LLEPGFVKAINKLRGWRPGIALIAALSCLLLGAQSAAALDPVSLQLKWRHQFQFAGYYAALAQGYYRDAGLDVSIREGGPDIDVAETVASGAADFGACSASILRDWPAGRHLVSLAAIFQHSPAIVISLRRAQIVRPAEMRGRRLMDTPGSDEIAAMLRSEGLDYDTLPRVVHQGDPRDLVADKADAEVAYSTNEPFILERLGLPYRSFAPADFGIDFYGDLLCTSEAEARTHPDRTAAFRAASLRGWDYALSHKDEIVDLIRSSYGSTKSREALLFEATRTEPLVRADPEPIGFQDPARWHAVAATYRDLGYLASDSVPAGLMWAGDDTLARWLRLQTLAPALLIVAAALILGRLVLRGRATGTTAPSAWRLPFATAFARPRLSVVMALLFVGLSIPILIFILVYNYERNSAVIIAMLDDAVAETSRVSIERTQSLVDSTEGALRMLAEVGATNPGYFRTEESRNLLYRALIAEPNLDAAYVSFEDGYHRVVTRIDEDRRRSDPQIPAAANWHSSYIDAVTDGLKRTRHRTFFDIWPHEVGAYDTATDLDVQTLPGYQQSKALNTLAVTPPTINPDTGFPVLSLRIPIASNGTFLGCASANITLDVLSRFLDRHRASPHSVTFIADREDSEIIAFPDMAKSVRLANGKLEIATLETIDEPDVRAAYAARRATDANKFQFRSPVNGADLIASFASFPGGFGQPWEVVTLTPVDDFVGTLKATNRLMMFVIISLTAVELLFIYFAAARLSRPVERVSSQLQAIQNLHFDAPLLRGSSIREISELESAASLLRSSLKSFSSFVPLDVVRQLVRSGIPLEPGVEPRALTIFFSDLENFSSHAERLAPSDLLVHISTYLETVTRAIALEEGTVDKFIGDGIMAFWGAPAPCDDHALRGCVAALRAARRMERVNEVWQAEGRPSIRMRIGLNSAQVLVGNVGSSERLSYTALGDGVNVAARLEGLNKQFGTTICISDSTFDSVRESILARPLKRVQVKGRKSESMVYELLGMIDSDDPELAPRAGDDRLSTMSWVAAQHVERGDLAAAAAAYRAILEIFPDDPVARTMLTECGMAAPLVSSE
jgi:class 3 adenylate cyclase/ABC-type nitrate/sulfonate/bicarbonate transport system substrate-binding protein